MPQRGWGSVTVPGAVSAWVSLSERFGKIPFCDLFEPAISYARNGYPVSPIIAASWARAAEALADGPGFAEAFTSDGRAPRAGETFRLPAMADTLELIAKTNGQAFYGGELAHKMIEFSTQGGGVMRLDDLALHQADWCGTVSLDWHGTQVHEIPPNGQGIAALIALGILREFPQLVDAPPDSPESIHLQLEAMKLAFADLHRYVSDLDHMEMAPEALIDPGYLQTRAALVDPARPRKPEYGKPPRGGTVYLTAADESGMMVSFIQSNYMGFGSGIVVPGTGISLQNRGCCFRSEPGHPNSVGPRKRPFQTIIPGFAMRDGQPLMSFGVMGGAMQAQGHVQMAVRVLLHGQNPQAACDAPRWQVLEDGLVAVEAAMPSTVVAELRGMGHEVSVRPGWADQSFGGAQLIVRSGDGYIAGSDQRKDGQAVGF
jgi:gamma-glutamyltranspeptidase/glutathione hydrolase